MKNRFFVSITILCAILLSCRSRLQDYNNIKSIYEKNKKEIEKVIKMFKDDSIDFVFRVNYDPNTRYGIKRYINKRQHSEIYFYLTKDDEREIFIHKNLKKFYSYLNDYKGDKVYLYKIFRFLYKQNAISMEGYDFGDENITITFYPHNMLIYIPSYKEFVPPDNDDLIIMHIEKEYFYYYCPYGLLN